VFERIILYKSKFLKETSSNQFGFQLGLSTYQPIFLLKETVNKYKKSKSPLYIASLDAEKAYDSLRRMGLFYKLKDKMDENLWLILMSYYEKSDGIIKFNSTGECLININSGVKQGGVLSPFLFNYFKNELIEKVINGDKSIIMNCGFKLYENNQIEIRIDGKLLETKDSCKYLGLMMNEKNDGNCMILDRFNQVRKSFFSLNSFGIKPVGVNTFIKSFLYNTYYLPKLTYGMGIYSTVIPRIEPHGVIRSHSFLPHGVISKKRVFWDFLELYYPMGL
jgi:hypothetical protein